MNFSIFQLHHVTGYLLYIITITHCLGLGHETMVSAICLSIFLCPYLTDCGGTCQIWMRFRILILYFCRIQFIYYREINDQYFSAPLPELLSVIIQHIMASQRIINTKLQAIPEWWVSGRQDANSSPPGQNGCHFADDNFRCVFVNEKFFIFINISLKFIPKGPIDNNPALV